MMMELKRLNGHGLAYTLRGDTEGNETVIHFRDKALMVKHNINEMNQAWFNWIRRGQYIQDAFIFLDPGEREFLITGLLPAEFDELMKDVDEDTAN